MSEHTPFLTIFPGCDDLRDSCGGLGEAYVTDVAIDEEERTLSIGAHFAVMPSMGDIAQLSERIRHDYILSGVSIIPEYPRPKLATAPAMGTAPRPGDPARSRSRATSSPSRVARSKTAARCCALTSPTAPARSA